MVFELLISIAKALDEAGIPYVLIGGQAVMFYGRPRVTEDIDLTLGARPDRFDEVAAIMARLGAEPVDMGMPPREMARTAMLYACQHRPTGMRIDLAFTFFDFEQEPFRRARVHQILGYPLRVVSPEDLIVMKLIAERAVDVEDIKAVYLRNQKQLDLAYLRARLEVYKQLLDRPLPEQFDALVASLERRLRH